MFTYSFIVYRLRFLEPTVASISALNPRGGQPPNPEQDFLTIIQILRWNHQGGAIAAEYVGNPSRLGDIENRVDTGCANHVDFLVTPFFDRQGGAFDISNNNVPVVGGGSVVVEVSYPGKFHEGLQGQVKFGGTHQVQRQFYVKAPNMPD